MPEGRAFWGAGQRSDLPARLSPQASAPPATAAAGPSTLLAVQQQAAVGVPCAEVAMPSPAIRSVTGLPSFSPYRRFYKPRSKNMFGALAFRGAEAVGVSVMPASEFQRAGKVWPRAVRDVGGRWVSDEQCLSSGRCASSGKCLSGWQGSSEVSRGRTVPELGCKGELRRERGRGLNGVTPAENTADSRPGGAPSSLPASVSG